MAACEAAIAAASAEVLAEPTEGCAAAAPLAEADWGEHWEAMQAERRGAEANAEETVEGGRTRQKERAAAAVAERVAGRLAARWEAAAAPPVAEPTEGGEKAAA